MKGCNGKVYRKYLELPLYAQEGTRVQPKERYIYSYPSSGNYKQEMFSGWQRWEAEHSKAPSGDTYKPEFTLNTFQVHGTLTTFMEVCSTKNNAPSSFSPSPHSRPQRNMEGEHQNHQFRKATNTPSFLSQGLPTCNV